MPLYLGSTKIPALSVLNPLTEIKQCDHVSVEQATPSISISNSGLITAQVTQSEGLVSSGTKSVRMQLAVQEGKTVTPSTSEQTAVYSGKYTTGNVVVAGDKNLKAENIAEGVSIFGVSGTHFSGTDTTDATITSFDVTKNKIGYGSEGKLVGKNPFEYNKREVEVALPINSDCYSVVYGNGRFVAVAYSSNKAVYSDDGITWYESVLPIETSWCSVIYGNGRFVAVTDYDDKAAYSDDGITWYETTMPSYEEEFRVLAYGNGRFVAVHMGYDDKAAYSDDGIAWNQVTMPSQNACYSVTYGNGKFIAVGTNQAFYSDDGITWNQATSPSTGSWRSVTYGNGRFVAIKSNKNIAQAAYSDDGITWYTARIPASSKGWSLLVYGNGKFVAVDGSNIVIHSDDGINWTDKPQISIATVDAEELTGFKSIKLSAAGCKEKTLKIKTVDGEPELVLGD